MGMTPLDLDEGLPSLNGVVERCGYKDCRFVLLSRADRDRHFRVTHFDKKGLKRKRGCNE